MVYLYGGILVYLKNIFNKSISCTKLVLVDFLRMPLEFDGTWSWLLGVSIIVIVVIYWAPLIYTDAVGRSPRPSDMVCPVPTDTLMIKILIIVFFFFLDTMFFVSFLFLFHVKFVSLHLKICYEIEIIKMELCYEIDLCILMCE